MEDRLRHDRGPVHTISVTCITDSYIIIDPQIGSLLLVFMQQIATGAVWAGVVLQAVTLISIILVIFNNFEAS